MIQIFIAQRYVDIVRLNKLTYVYFYNLPEDVGQLKHVTRIVNITCFVNVLPAISLIACTEHPRVLFFFYYRANVASSNASDVNDRFFVVKFETGGNS